MYLFYEVFGETDPDVNNHVYEFVCSSDGRTNVIHFYSPREKVFHGIISQMFKTISIAERSWEQSTYITTLIGLAGKRMVVTVESGIKNGLLARLDLSKITDLRSKLAAGNLSYVPPSPRSSSKPVEVRFKVEEFFYQDASPKELSGEALHKALATMLLLEVSSLKIRTESELKKQYRLRAMALHPDRNNGDGSQMAELNRLWSLFNAK